MSILTMKQHPTKHIIMQYATIRYDFENESSDKITWKVVIVRVARKR